MNHITASWALILTFGLAHAATGSQEDRHVDAPPPSSNAVKPMTPMDTPPIYHTLTSYDPKWKAMIEEGIEMARSYWGSYGPTHVWIVGYDEGQAPDSKAELAFVEDYCRWRIEDTQRTMAECRPYATGRFIDVARSGTPEAYLSDVRERTPRMAELVFINVHKWYFERDRLPDPIARGIHEYTHVAQHGFGHMPTWMMEGGAVFSEAWLPALAGKRKPEQMLGYVMDNAQKMAKTPFTIADMESIETAPPEVAQYHRELAYDAGAWATIFMVYHTPTRCVSTLRDVLYPRVTEVGWEQALCEYVDMPSKEAFYKAFASFMAKPREEHMRIFRTLQP